MDSPPAEFKVDEGVYEPPQEFPQTEFKGYVGPLVSTQAITEEYAKADPTYIKKTTSLPSQFSHYRIITRDGNCGWRALAYGYFELILRSGDADLALNEMARLTSLNTLMIQVGLQEFLFEDWVQESLDTLKVVMELISQANRHDTGALLEIFNDQGRSDAIITHFKLLTSSFMKTNPSEYEPFIEVPLSDYCDSHIDRYGEEIDNIGLKALVDCILVPAGLAVEIAYLDRSEGDEVNFHRFAGDSAKAPVLHLLYRPGHYDLLYKIGDIPVQSNAAIPHQQGDVQVHMVHSQQYYTQPFTSSVFGGLSQQPFPPSTIPSHTQPPHIDFQPDIPQTIPYPSTPFNNMPSNFRPSAFQLKAAQQEEVPFQTKTFKNSHFNKSHFLNDEFQPEMYNPDGGSDSDEMMF